MQRLLQHVADMKVEDAVMVMVIVIVIVIVINLTLTLTLTLTVADMKVEESAYGVALEGDAALIQGLFRSGRLERGLMSRSSFKARGLILT